VIPDTAIEAVTWARNMSAFGDHSGSLQAVRRNEVVAELRELEGLSEKAARQLGREAVQHVGGEVEPVIRRGGIAAGRMRSHADEVWWVPRSAIHS
jgi:hypothetical protein